MQNTLIRTLGALALLVVGFVPACTCGGGGLPACTGGAQLVGNGCYCPTGTTANGASCVGTPQQGSCPAGQLEVVGSNGASCFCPEGQVWSDPSMTACSACVGGAVASGDQCVCPDGTSWDGTQCAAVAQQTCTGGGVMTDQGCQCPDGTAWDGANCSAAPPQEQPQQQQVIQQQTVHRSATVSLTCCVNHAQYTCPTQQAFTACATMQANHGCTRAGGC